MRFGRFILNNFLLIFLVLGNPLRGGDCGDETVSDCCEGGFDYRTDGHYCQWNYTGSDCCAYYARDFDGDGWGDEDSPLDICTILWDQENLEFSDDPPASTLTNPAYVSNNNDSNYYGVIITKSSGKKTDPIKFMTRDHK